MNAPSNDHSSNRLQRAHNRSHPVRPGNYFVGLMDLCYRRLEVCKREPTRKMESGGGAGSHRCVNPLQTRSLGERVPVSLPEDRGDDVVRGVAIAAIE